jgi:hypothetical protein
MVEVFSAGVGGASAGAGVGCSGGGVWVGATTRVAVAVGWTAAVGCTAAALVAATAASIVASMPASAVLVAAIAALTVAATSASDGPGVGVGPKPQAIIVRITTQDATITIGDRFIGYLLTDCIDMISAIEGCVPRFGRSQAGTCPRSFPEPGQTPIERAIETVNIGSVGRVICSARIIH